MISTPPGDAGNRIFQPEDTDMRPDRQKSQKQNGVSSYLFPVVLIFCMFMVIVIVGIYQVKGDEAHVHEEALSNLNLDAQIISRQLNDMYLSLESAAPVLSYQAGFSKMQMLQTMTALREACGFDFVVRTNQNGIAFNDQGKENIVLSGRSYIHQALQGERACEYVSSGTYDPSSAYVILAVPIRCQGSVVGVLHGSCKASNFDQLLRKLDTDRKDFSSTFIMSESGILIAASDRKADCQAFADLLQHDSAADSKEAEQAASDLNAGNSGFVEIRADGQREFAYYTPLSEVETSRWLMVSTVTQSSFLERTRSIKTGTILLCMTAGCITAALIWLVIRWRRLVVLQRKEAKTLSVALVDAKKANRAKSEFLSRMSHDMRTPLNGIIGMTYLAQEIKNPPQTGEYLNKIETASKFLLGLINDVLDMARAESGKMELHPEPYAMQQFLAYIDAVIRPLCREKGIHLVFDLKPVAKHRPLMDPLRFNQLCFNLLSNAVKYTPEGGTVTLRIRDQMLPDNRLSMELEISDTGIGMTREFQKTMFEAFTQENRDDASPTRGSGLGLAISRKIIDLMGGTVEVFSEPGKGTRYHIHFVFDSVPAETEMQKEPEKHAADYTGLAGKHVLLCEDHPLNQELVRTLLTQKGMIVEIAENGLVGTNRFFGSVPGYYSVILMDIRMPVMDGYEAAKTIRAMNRPDAGKVPILAMTADAFTEDIQRCLDAGMNGHIAKPIDPEGLFQTLADIVGAEKNES